MTLLSGATKFNPVTDSQVSVLRSQKPDAQPRDSSDQPTAGDIQNAISMAIMQGVASGKGVPSVYASLMPPEQQQQLVAAGLLDAPMSGKGDKKDDGKADTAFNMGANGAMVPTDTAASVPDSEQPGSTSVQTDPRTGLAQAMAGAARPTAANPGDGGSTNPGVRNPPEAPGIMPVIPAPQRDIASEGERNQQAIQDAQIPGVLASMFGGHGVAFSPNGTSAGMMAAALQGAHEGEDRTFGEQGQNYDLASKSNTEEQRRQAEKYQQELGAYSAQTMAGWRNALAGHYGTQDEIRSEDVTGKNAARASSSLNKTITNIQSMDGTQQDKYNALLAAKAQDPGAFGQVQPEDLWALAGQRPAALDYKAQTADAATARAKAQQDRVQSYADWVKNEGSHWSNIDTNAKNKSHQDDAHFAYMMQYRYNQLSQSADADDQRTALALEKASQAMGAHGAASNPGVREMVSQISRLGKLDDNLRQYKKQLDKIYTAHDDPSDVTASEQIAIGHSSESIKQLDAERQRVLKRIESLQDNTAATAAGASVPTATAGVPPPPSYNVPQLGPGARSAARSAGYNPTALPAMGSVGASARAAGGGNVPTVMPATVVGAGQAPAPFKITVHLTPQEQQKVTKDLQTYSSLLPETMQENLVKFASANKGIPDLTHVGPEVSSTFSQPGHEVELELLRIQLRRKLGYDKAGSNNAAK